jgi:hypothetical protein
MQPKAHDLADSLEIAGDRLLGQLLPLVQEEFKYVAGRRGEVLLEKVAKDPMTSERLRERAQRYLLSSPRS